MVLVQSAPQSLLSRVHPNPSRILGVAGAVALNAAVLMALMLPMDLPLPKTTTESTTELVELRRPLPKPIPPPVVPVERRPQVSPAPQPRTLAPPVDVPTVVTRDASPIDVPDVEPATDAPAADTTPAQAGPMVGVALRYARATPPPYPREEMLAGREGTVLLRVLVGVDGRPLEVAIERSSGSRDLDRAAQRHVQKTWLFEPATRDGQPIQAIGIVPIDFKLQ